MEETGYLVHALGATPDLDYIGRGRIKVVRKGRYHPVYSFVFDGQKIAHLECKAPRKFRYTIVGSSGHLDLHVGHMLRKIDAIDDSGRISKILSPGHNGRPNLEMQVQMYSGDNFIARRNMNDRWGVARVGVRKQHYRNNLLIFHYDKQDGYAPIFIDVERLMRWEMANFHLLLALVTARIGLEHKLDGAH
jgi:hypothetical protein